jgi:hypothetical protein
MMKLSSQAKSALDRVVNANIAYRTARENFEAELQAELEAKLTDYVAERNRSVVLADRAGVPRTQIGRAMGTSNYRTVQEILEQASDSIDIAEGDNNTWAISTCGDGTYDLTITNLGAAGVTGHANIRLNGKDIEFVDGDPFVVPQVYRNGLAQEIVNAI